MPLDRQKHSDTQPKTQPYAVRIRQNETENTASENIKLDAKKKHATACFFSCMGFVGFILCVELLFCCDVVFLLSWGAFRRFFLCGLAFCGFVAIERSRCAVSVQRRATRRTGFVGGAVLCAAILAFDHFHFHAFGERNARLDF